MKNNLLTLTFMLFIVIGNLSYDNSTNPKPDPRPFVVDLETTPVEVFEGISKRYEIDFIEIGTDEGHINFLI